MNDVLNLCAKIIDYIDEIDNPTNEETDIKRLAYKIRQAEEMRLWNI